MVLMRARPTLAALAVVSSFVSIAAAQAPAAGPEQPTTTAEAPPVAGSNESGIELGARVGWGFPLGDASERVDMSEVLLGQIPLQLDVGYRLNPQLVLGGYFSYGIAFSGRDNCGDEGLSCSASDVRLGIQGIYHFTPVTEGNAAWVGAGAGYEWASWEFEFGASQSSSGSLDGFEFVNLQGGYDFAVSDHFRVGPYGMFTLAQFSNQSAGLDGNEQEVDIDKDLHQWLFVGVKGSFGPL